MIKIIPIIRQILLGAKDAIPVVASIKENIIHPAGGEGKVAKIRLLSAILMSLCLILGLGLGFYLLGKGTIQVAELISLMEALKDLVKAIKP